MHEDGITPYRARSKAIGTRAKRVTLALANM